MKRILYIAPHSFPIKSSESICNSKVAYVLASMGYQIDVFACSDSSTYPKDSKIDQFLQEVPNMRIFTVRPSKKNFYRTASITSNLKCIPHNLKVFFKTGFYYNVSQLLLRFYKPLRISSRAKVDFIMML